MTVNDFLDLSRDGITVLLIVVGPLMLVSLVVGMAIAR